MMFVMKDQRYYGIKEIFLDSKDCRLRAIYAYGYLKVIDFHEIEMMRISQNLIAQETYHNHREMRQFDIFYKPHPKKETRNE